MMHVKFSNFSLNRLRTCEVGDASKTFCYLVKIADNFFPLTNGLHDSILSYFCWEEIVLTIVAWTVFVIAWFVIVVAALVAPVVVVVSRRGLLFIIIVSC